VLRRERHKHDGCDWRVIHQKFAEPRSAFTFCACDFLAEMFSRKKSLYLLNVKEPTNTFIKTLHSEEKAAKFDLSLVSWNPHPSSHSLVATSVTPTAQPHKNRACAIEHCVTYVVLQRRTTLSRCGTATQENHKRFSNHTRVRFAA
jgi:hypothetical protein